MSEPLGTTDLQFDRAEYVAPETLACGACRTPITDEYYQVNGTALCASCKEQVAQWTGGALLPRLLKASALGLVAALAGGAIWYGIRAATNMEIGIVAILVGFMVGRAVRIGSNNTGGRIFQVLAVVLTYSGVAANYVPDIMKAFNSKETFVDAPAVLKLALSMVLAFVAPFLAGLENILGILIIGFALWEAWKVNRRVPVQIAGPLKMTPPAPSVVEPEVISGG